MTLKKVAIYARVSTAGQDTENQLIELRRYVEARNWPVTEFVDKGLSGAKTEEQRPALKALMQAARKKQIEAVVVWDFSRFARSMRQLVDALDLFSTLNIAFISLREGIDTTTANGRLMFGIFASLAEFERELIKERVLLGLQRARNAGKQLGRPKCRYDASMLVQLKKSGNSVRAISKAMGISIATVSRDLRALQKPGLIPAS